MVFDYRTVLKKASQIIQQNSFKRTTVNTDNSSILDAIDIATEIRDLVAVVAIGFEYNKEVMDDIERRGFDYLCILIEQKADKIIDILDAKRVNP
jgi:hypothetical protein